jgi:hypothetical protein
MNIDKAFAYLNDIPDQATREVVQLILTFIKQDLADIGIRKKAESDENPG